MMQLSCNFTLEEFTRSSIAEGQGIAVEPTFLHIANLRRLCSLVLQPLRDEVGPIRVHSGYRPPRLNRLVGGAHDSQHKRGQAADVSSESHSPYELAMLVYDKGLAFDQMIIAPRYLHVSVDENPRGMVLTRTTEGEYLRGAHHHP